MKTAGKRLCGVEPAGTVAVVSADIAGITNTVVSQATRLENAETIINTGFTASTGFNA